MDWPSRALALAVSRRRRRPPPTGDRRPRGATSRTAIETGRLDEAGEALGPCGAGLAGALAQGIVGAASRRAGPGFLVLNPLGVPRRCRRALARRGADLRPEGPLRAAQFTDEGVWAVVDLPAFGFAWVPREPNLEALARAPVGSLSVRDRVLRNESIEVEIDAATGGHPRHPGRGEETARLGQQLVVAGLVGPDGKPVASQMRGESFEVDYGGPALVQAVPPGTIARPGDDRPLARFRAARTGSGPAGRSSRSTSTLATSTPPGSSGSPRADPWEHYLACRWAWPDPSSMLRRTGLLGPELTEAERPETPDALDISTRRQRTALLFGGLAHHRKPRDPDARHAARRRPRVGPRRSGWASCSTWNTRSTPRLT